MPPRKKRKSSEAAADAEAANRRAGVTVTRDWALEAKKYAEDVNAEEKRRAAAWIDTLAQRVEAVCNADGGYIREHADDFCPTAMPLAEQVALGEHIDTLFRGDDAADAQRVQDF
eukprot:COSAG06_NODE_25572_length_633_cov_1.902622_1_plen_115_part_00